MMNERWINIIRGFKPRVTEAPSEDYSSRGVYLSFRLIDEETRRIFIKKQF